jgi:hypothetical protein
MQTNVNVNAKIAVRSFAIKGRETETGDNFLFRGNSQTFEVRISDYDLGSPVIFLGKKY